MGPARRFIRRHRRNLKLATALTAFFMFIWSMSMLGRAIFANEFPEQSAMSFAMALRHHAPEAVTSVPAESLAAAKEALTGLIDRTGGTAVSPQAVPEHAGSTEAYPAGGEAVTAHRTIAVATTSTEEAENTGGTADTDTPADGPEMPAPIAEQLEESLDEETAEQTSALWSAIGSFWRKVWETTWSFTRRMTLGLWGVMVEFWEGLTQGGPPTDDGLPDDGQTPDTTGLRHGPPHHSNTIG